ncbi:MAG: AAA family ATPase [Clostridia bacterium]|nr:AAA family ATPase [Clostridia bacterium]
MNKELERIISLMPDRAANAIREECNRYNGRVDEIRLRTDRPASLSVDRENIVLDLRCTVSEMRGVLLALCDGSPYAFADAIERGYIPQKNGVRCGVCPAKGSRASIESVSSICIRLPWERSEPDGISELCTDKDRVVSTLLYSPPGVGKTTVLRFLIKRLCSGENAMRGAVIDTRGELFLKSLSYDTLTDYLFGYEKGEGIELAVRTLSPQVVFCDEIGLGADADAILAAENTGVPLIASAHADTLEALLKRPQIARLHEYNVFERYVGIKREKSVYSFEVSKA